MCAGTRQGRAAEPARHHVATETRFAAQIARVTLWSPAERPEEIPT